MNNIKSVIESILFFSGDSVLISDLQKFFDISHEEIVTIINELIEEKYSEASGIRIFIAGDAIYMTTNEENYKFLEEYFNFDNKKNLTKSALEVISIIAYKQPVTKSEIDNIRGVKSDYILNRLLDEEFIFVSDKLDAPGLPNLYSTTDKFLKQFNLNSLEDLPKVEAEDI